MKWYQRFSWVLLRYTFCKFLKFKFNVSAEYHKDNPEQPFILLSNHANVTDPFFIGLAEPIPISYIANMSKASLVKRVFSKLVRTITKKKAEVDAKALREVFVRLKSGENIGLFPEGDRSWDGETAMLFPNTVRLIRKMKIPIRLVRLEGNYLTNPRWAKYKRIGKITIDFDTITLNEIKNMSDSELMNKIKSYIYNNDVKNETIQKIKFKGEKTAEGIEFLLWLCPHCKSHDTIYGEGDNIRCCECGSKWETNANQKITPETGGIRDTKDWFDLQNKEITNIIESGNEILTETKDIEFHIPSEKGSHQLYGKGTLILTHKKMIFKPDKEIKELKFDVNMIKFYADNFNRNFEFTYEKDRNRILFNGKNANKWIYFLNQLKANKVKV